MSGFAGLACAPSTFLAGLSCSTRAVSVLSHLLSYFVRRRHQCVDGTKLAVLVKASDIRRALSRCTSVFLAVACVSCAKHDVTVEFYFADGYHFSQSERSAIQTVAAATAIEVRHFLPALPHDLVLRVQAGKDVIPETGETAYAVPPNAVRWLVDPSRTGGVTGTIRRELRATLFHESHHLVRYATVKSGSLMDEVVTEGMATAFERDFAGASPPWGMYPDDILDWVNELSAVPPDANRGYWLTKRHADARRWIGMRAGTYLVDRASRSSGQSSAELVSTPTAALLRMALGR